MGRLVGVDIGGTGVRAAAVDGNGRLGPVARRDLANRDPDTVIGAVADLVSTIGEVGRVGVGVPGFVRAGTVIASPNFPAWIDVPLQARLGAVLDVPVTVENDANCAALGAWRVRGGREDLVLLTLGTGVGGGVVTGGRLLRGAGGTGAEVGHVFVGGEVPCGCGGLGCLETWCGTVGLVRRARDRGLEVADGAAVVSAAEVGEAWAIGLLAASGEALGRGLVTLVNVFNPDVVMVAGGLAAARPFLAPPAEAWLRRYGIAPSVDRLAVVWEGPADGFAIAGAATAAEGAR